jgi:hypothetical protein
MDEVKLTGTGPLQNPLEPVMELLQGGNPELICSRYGITRSELDRRLKDYQTGRRQMALMDQLVISKAGRNEPCPCGSGKKYKKCCLGQHEEARKSLPRNVVRDMENQVQRRETLEKDIQRGWDLLFSQEFSKVRRLTESLLQSFPEDDRIHDMLASVDLATGNYEAALNRSRLRWQVAQEEKTYFQEHGCHKRQSDGGSANFFSPSTWLEKFWIAQRACNYQSEFPTQDHCQLQDKVAKLQLANDVTRFPARQGEGFDMRRKALEPVLSELANAGPAAIPYLLPLAYHFSWASLFVPELLFGYGTETSIRLLAELSMFRHPYFAQRCLSLLEQLGERAVPQISRVLRENSAFDELKTGLIMVLGSIPTAESFALLVELIDHENPYVVNSVAQSLGRQKNPEALPHLEKARKRLGEPSVIAGAIRDLVHSPNL